MPRTPKVPFQAAEQLRPAPEGLYVGTSGWAYPSWKPGFYPKDVPSRSFLPYYASELTSVEVNYTFRTLPHPEQLRGWLDATPEGFQFSFKAPQRITHFARLQQCTEVLERFLAAVRPAQQAGKLGLALFQLPPNFKADLARLKGFLQTPALRTTDAPRIAFEFRHASWFEEDIFDLLRSHNAAVCVADTDDLQTPEVMTADFCCYRLRRDGGYRPEEIDSFARRFTALANTKPTFVYLRHQEEPRGALNARDLLSASWALSGTNAHRDVMPR